MQEVLHLFANLSKRNLTLEQKKVEFVHFFGECGETLFQELFPPTYREFQNWLITLLKDEPLPSTIQGINFGLYETIGGFEIYLSGSNLFSPDDSDWACANDYWPEGRCAKLSTYDDITERLEKLDIEPWMYIQAMTILLIDNFLKEENTKNIIPEHIHIACGFDSGDLYLIER
jgi:hypothetical protein